MNRSTIFIILLIAQFSLFSMALIKKHKSSLTINTPPSSLLSTDPSLEDAELRSPNGFYSLTLGKKGVLKLKYTEKKNGGISVNEIWQAGYSEKGWNSGNKLTMQPDGNLVTYNGNTEALWSTGTDGKGGIAPYKFTMQDDGNAVLYDKDNKVMWSTGTFGKK